MDKYHSISLWRLCLCGLFWSCYTIATAQVERQIANHWYFGNQYGINFIGGNAQQDNNSALFTYEASTTISDKTGNLLFYTNGGGRVDSTVLGYIWNRNHEVMEGGELGAFSGGGYSAAQGAISILKPGTTDQYYLFTIDEVETLYTEGNPLSEGKGLSRFDIDMAANGGLGKVTLSNEKLLAPAFEHLSITKHGNCEDYWLLARTGHAVIANNPMVADSFYLYKITDLGIEAPIITPIPDGLTEEHWTFGLIRFAPDGRHFISGPFLFDFDKNTGAIGGVIDLQNTIGVSPPFPLSFSPDGQQLFYFSLINQGQVNSPMIKLFSFQYDVETIDNNHSSEISFELEEAPVSNLVGTPQLAPDGKMYLPVHHGIQDEPTRIYVVDFPNKKDAGVQFHGPVFELSPPFTDPFLRFGNYTDHIFYFDSIETIDLDLADEIIMDCQEVEPIIISSPENFECMLWSTGDTSSTIEINAEGVYWLEVADGCDIGRDSFEVIYENDLFEIELGNDTSLCEGESISLVAEVIADAVYTWQDSSDIPFFIAEEGGLYWVEMRLDACYDRDSIFLEFRNLPTVDIISDTVICLESELILDASGPFNWTYEWQDGSTETTLAVPEIGLYSVTVTNDCGLAADSVFINMIECESCNIDFPNAFSPNRDGVSDVFAVVTDCDFIFFNLKIFNRWGEMIYTGISDSDTWDGNVKGQPGSSDVYFYLLEYETINPLGMKSRGVRSGDLTLLR